MPLWVSHEAIVAARRAPLYDYLLSRHPADVRREGNSLRLRSNHSLSIKRGYSGYTDFSTGETGNAVDCLIRYLGYDFQGAVAALCAYTGIPAVTDSQPQPRTAPKTAPGAAQEPLKDPPRVFILPEPSRGQNRHLYAYLTQRRGIPPVMVQQLIDWGLLSQEAEHANMVFVNPEKTFAELRGTVPGKPFHRVLFSDPTAFWGFKANGPGSDANIAYVCEAAIDALSLYLLHLTAGIPDGENGLYCSIGGVANQQRINAIRDSMSATGGHTVLAVDNDDAGELCRRKNPDCPAIFPQLKDWNDDLLATIQQKEG